MFDLGDDAYLTMSFTDSSTPPAFINVTGLTLTIALPDETTVGPFTPTNDSLGHYHYQYSTVQAGQHVATWTGTTPKVKQVQEFYVESATDIALVSVDVVKTQLNMTSTVFDEDLRGYILSASENIEKVSGVCAPRTFSERCEGDWALTVSKIPVLSVTSLTPVFSWDQTLAPADVITDLNTGVICRTNGYEFTGPYTVVYKAGRHAVPASLRTACSLIVQYLWVTRRGPQQAQQTGGMETVQPVGWPYEIPVWAAGLLFSFPGAPGFA